MRKYFKNCKIPSRILGVCCYLAGDKVPVKNKPAFETCSVSDFGNYLTTLNFRYLKGNVCNRFPPIVRSKCGWQYL